jgi:tetratricopeptide (TPR) repeat protein
MDKTKSGSSRLERRILIAYYATLALLAIGTFLESGRVWGFNWWSYFPVWVGLSVVLALGLVPFVIQKFQSTGSPEPSTAKFWLWSLAGIAGCIAVFSLFANTTHFLGDGLQILHNVQTATPTNMFWNIPAEWLQQKVFSFTGGKSEADAKLAIQLISYVCGALSIVALLWTGRRLGLGILDSWLFCLGVITSGLGFFFFGYVETYPPFIGATILTCLLSLLALDSKISRWWPAVACLLAITLHLFAITLLPAILYLLLRPTAVWQRLLRLPGYVRYSLLVVLILLGSGLIVYKALHNYEIRFMLVPLFADRFTVDGYTLFSSGHLLDLGNLVFFLIPSVALVIAGIFGKWKHVWKSPVSRFLMIAALGGAALVCVFDPKLGMLRDWDLFAFAAIPVVILWSLLCLGRERLVVAGRALLILTILLNLAVLAPRVAVAMSKDRSLNMVEQIFTLERAKSRSLHYLTVDYLRSHGLKSRGDSLQVTTFVRYPEIKLQERAAQLYDRGRSQESIAVASQALAINPSFVDSYTLVCVAYASLGRFSDAIEMGQIARGLNPRNPDIAYNMANINARMGNVDEARRYLEICLKLDTAHQPALYGMASLAVAEGDRADLQKWLVRLPINDTVEASKFSDLVKSACVRDMFDLATDMLRFGVEHRLDSAVVLEIVRQYPQIQTHRR